MDIPTPGVDGLEVTLVSPPPPEVLEDESHRLATRDPVGLVVHASAGKLAFAREVTTHR